jgi:hypothetical protein
MKSMLETARRALLALSLVLTAAAGAPARADESAPADGQRLPPMRVDAERFNASPEDIRAVCESAARELIRGFPSHHELEPILIRRGDENPIALFRRSDRGEIEIRLNTSDAYWSQYAYQFAHEFCHVLCGFHPGSHHLWFEEVLCETASQFALRGMGRSWAEAPPYPHWSPYRDRLRAYVDEICLRALSPELQRDGLARYFEARRETLQATPTDRARNAAIAVILLPHFEQDPARWEALRWYHHEAALAPKDETFEQHLARWKRGVPERHREFVATIASLFGVADAPVP